MKTLNIIVAFLALVFLNTSCNKCEVEDVSTGIIETEGQLRIVGNPYGSELIREQHPEGIEYLISYDEGVTYEPVDFTKYDLMVLPTQSSCLASYYKDVKLDVENEKVVYTLRIEECGTCNQQVSLKNWVLIDKVPANYTPEFILE